jgi:hypothetical protein
MNINAAIIDQRLSAVCDEIRERAQEELNITEEERLKSLAFLYLSVKIILDLSDDESFECLTEGSSDFGVDAIHLSEEHDGEFTVSLFQGKYKRNLEGNANFPEAGIKALINAIRHLFDPGAILENINDRLKAKVEEVRSLIRDGYIPQVRALACNNGLKWNEAASEEIKRAELEFGNQVTWEHVNHDNLVTILQATKGVNESLHLSGKAITEDFNFSRVLLGKIAVTEIATLIERHGERLLERNIRRYLGLQGNRVNKAIRQTLKGDDKSNFYFYNNGITLICDKFTYNALQSGDFQVNVENLQIINGGQTCITIFKTLQNSNREQLQDIYILVRLYQLPTDNDDLVRRITFATNSQNPVDLRDLRSNDEKQRRLETDIAQLGFSYRRKRTDSPTKSKDITSRIAALAILSVWKQEPHRAKFFKHEHFGKFYESIFSDDLNGAQVILAVLIYRIAENRRRRPLPNDPQFLRYASCFIAMQMGKYLLNDLNCKLLTHENFKDAQKRVEQEGAKYFDKAVLDIKAALEKLYEKGAQVPLQQLSATFRRGDLINILSPKSKAKVLNSRKRSKPKRRPWPPKKRPKLKR